MKRDYETIKKINRGFVYINRMVNAKEKKEIKLAKVNVTRRELEYISVIKDYEGIKQNLILDFLDVSKSTWSSQLKTLLKKGLIIIRSDIRDKRAKLVYLTDEGEKVYQIHKKVRLQLLKGYGKILTDSEISSLIKIGQKIIDGIGRKKINFNI